MKNINFLFCLTKIYLCNLQDLNIFIQHFSFNYTLNVTFFFMDCTVYSHNIWEKKGEQERIGFVI